MWSSDLSLEVFSYLLVAEEQVTGLCEHNALPVGLT
jgi:hypothetical protein